MAVSYANHTEIIDTDANNSVTVTVPASLAQDEMWVVTVAIDTNGGTFTINTPSGFTQIGSQFDGANDGFPECALYYKIAGASESSVTLTYFGADFDAVVYSIRITKEAGEALALDAIGTVARPTGAGTTVDAPDITVGADGSLAILFWALGGNSGAAPAPTAPAGSTKQDDREGFPGCAFATQSVNSGAFAPGNWSWTGSLPNRLAQTFSIKPAVPGVRRQSPVYVNFSITRAFSY